MLYSLVIRYSIDNNQRKRCSHPKATFPSQARNHSRQRPDPDILYPPYPNPEYYLHVYVRNRLILSITFLLNLPHLRRRPYTPRHPQPASTDSQRHSIQISHQNGQLRPLRRLGHEIEIAQERRRRRRSAVDRSPSRRRVRRWRLRLRLQLLL